MQPEVLNTSFEAINNPILKLLLYALLGAVGALSTAVYYLFKKYVSLNEDSVKALYGVKDSLEKIAEKI